MHRKNFALAATALCCMLVSACGKKTLNLDDAGKSATFNLNAPANVSSVELEVTGLLSGHGRLHLFKPQNTEIPWKTLDFNPVVVSGIPMGIAPIRFREKYTEQQLIIKYEPSRKTQGHFELQYRFRSS